MSLTCGYYFGYFFCIFTATGQVQWEKPSVATKESTPPPPPPPPPPVPHMMEKYEDLIFMKELEQEHAAAASVMPWEIDQSVGVTKMRRPSMITPSF